MKKLLIVALALAPALGIAQTQPLPAGITAPSSTEVLQRARLDGELAGDNAGGWMGRSFLAGVGAGLIGTGVVFGIAAGGTPQLPTDQRLLIASKPTDYQVMYTKGYSDKVKSKHKKTAIGGGLLGTAAFVGLILATSSSSTGY
ncbi:MAG: hypothetical protein ABJB74_01930 [Gemmatimonas sp.]